ncbi:MAG: hypothetical protein COA88_07305 [Kordia sp.]|nr:MAG: hypothetical protein COA88_07305 [Kordia sp.]
MNKIKKIEISDFRIYEGKEEFNFETDNGLANLVALYAPNGFGKTSFFDAIEWTFSDKIKRFQDKLMLKVIKEEKEDTILLTNAISYKKGLRGRVRIVTDEDFFLEKTVETLKKRNLPYYNDYRQGALSEGAMSSEGLSKIPETNILTQDQIDAFLRFKTPEQKFEALKEFWPESEDATEKLKKLSELYNVVSNNINITKANLIEHEDNLEKLTKDNKNITQVNLWLQKVKEQEIYDINMSIEKIDETITQENYDLIYEDNLKNIKNIALEIDKVELIKSKLDILKGNLALYISDNEKIIELKERLVQYQNRKSNFLNLKKSKEIEKSISDEILRVKLQIKQYKYLDLHIIDYKSDIKKIEEFKNENQSSIKENTKILDDIEVIKKSNSKFKDGKRQCNSTLLEKEKQQSNVDKQYAEFIRIDKGLIEQKKDLNQLKLKVNEKEVEIEKLQKSNQLFTEIIKQENYSSNIFSDNNQYILLCKKLKENVEAINKLKVDITLKKEKLDKAGSLNENLDKIILFGEDYITATNSSDCPLCKSSFKTFEDLLEKVKLDKKDTLKLTEQQNEIINLENERVELLKNKTELIKSINDIIIFESGKISKNILNIQGVKNKLSNEMNDINNNIINLEFELKVCKDFFSKLIEITNLIDIETITTLKEELNAVIKKLKKEEDKLKVAISKNEADILNKETEYSTNQSKLSKNKNSIESIEGKEVYQKIEKIIKELNLDNSKLEKTVNENSIITIDNELLIKSDSLNKILKELIAIKKNISDDIIQIDEANLEGSISEIEALLKSENESTANYKVNFNKLISSEEINDDVIKNHQSNHQKKLENLLSLSKDLNSLSVDLELIKENITRNNLEKEIKNLESILPKLINSFKKIDAAKNDCMSYVETGINNYFNKDVINEIYKRIEPHPKLTEIHFSTDFNDKGEPRLLIRTGNENEEEEKVNPILFLSAGQVNVLSLSIFLAKAFEYGNETIETIFMDDPIQNLSDINVLSFIDLLRTLISTHDKQIVISTHDEKFFRLLQNKLPEEYCSTKYFEFESEGKLKKIKTEAN